MTEKLTRYTPRMTEALILPAGLAALLYSTHLLSVGLAAWRLRPRANMAVAPCPTSGVTLVRPVCGLDSHVEETLRSSLEQNIRPFEVIFCAAREDDPVVPLVRRLIAEHPQVEARLLIGEDRLGQNPKLNNMAKGWRDATYDTVIFADSNLLLTPDYCERVISGFRADVGVVSSPPVGSHPEGFWSEVECAMLNTHAARWQLAASALGMDFAQGKTLAFRKGDLGPNLMRALSEEPAEDAAATKLAQRKGLCVNLIGPPWSHPVGRRSMTAVWNRHTRWARLRRATFPVLFGTEIISGIVPATVLALYALWLADSPMLPALAAAPLLWYAPEYGLARLGRWHLTALSPLAWLMRDLLLPAFYVAGWASTNFVWNGHQMSGAKQDDEPAGQTF